MHILGILLPLLLQVHSTHAVQSKVSYFWHKCFRDDGSKNKAFESNPILPPLDFEIVMQSDVSGTGFTVFPYNNGLISSGILVKT